MIQEIYVIELIIKFVGYLDTNRSKMYSPLASVSPFRRTSSGETNGLYLVLEFGSEG